MIRFYLVVLKFYALQFLKQFIFSSIDCAAWHSGSKSRLCGQISESWSFVFPNEILFTVFRNSWRFIVLNNLVLYLKMIRIACELASLNRIAWVKLRVLNIFYWYVNFRRSRYVQTLIKHFTRSLSFFSL